MTGRFSIIGVGPGDPELMTLKAARVLAEADVVAYPTSRGGGLAAEIAAAHLGSAQHMPFAVPMTGDGAARAAYDAAAAAIGDHLAAGRHVALLCEGDPMVYGSAASVMARLHDVRPRIVPGVVAATAAAASAGVSLVRGADSLTLLPATKAPAALAATLRAPGAVVLYKVGRHFDTVRGLVRAAGRHGTLVCHATTPAEEIHDLDAAPAGEKPYFSAILLPAHTVAPAAKPAPTARVAIVALSETALATAQKAAAALRATHPHIEVHGLAGRVAEGSAGADVLFADARRHVGTLFGEGVTIIGLCAAGILIRAVAPFLADKTAEPPVLALSEDGASVVPLLGAHNGGAAIAATLAAAFETRAALTTRSEAVLGIALDDPPPGFVVADAAPFKRLAAALPAGGPGRADPALTFLPPREGWPLDIAATTAPPADDGPPTYITRRIALGMGAERGAPPAEAIAMVREALHAAGIDARAVAVVASLDKKADEAALAAVADDLGAPLRVFDTAALALEEPRLTAPSETVRAAVGVAGVAEAAALAAAGPAAVLRVPKTVRGQLTLALAEAPAPIPATVGRARGHLAIVGIGPGAAAWRTGEAASLLAGADAFVGYSLYLDLVDNLIAGRPRHDFPLGAETERTRHALELAGAGQTVALVSSGDAGIYAMASLAFELLDTGDLSDAARRVAVTVAPGISAAQAAAARVGAPLGHDFAFISLSDLLTPWPAIRRRLEATATADFAVALYNPRSRRRTRQLEEAAAIFRAARPATTPVVVAQSLGRPAEAIHHTTLGAFDPATVDMLATVLIGASTTRRFIRGDGRAAVYTPRGYEVTP
ncbi:MAG: hypothetical protein AcusKO_18260 [Acuticoccus sp.]